MYEQPILTNGTQRIRERASVLAIEVFHRKVSHLDWVFGSIALVLSEQCSAICGSCNSVMTVMGYDGHVQQA